MTIRPGLKRNVAANLGGYVINVMVAFVVTPIIIRSLGDARYGTWALISQLVGYYGLMDLGIRGAISHYVAGYLATNEPMRLRSIVGSGFWLLAGAGIAVMVAGCAVTVFCPYIFNLADVPVGEVRKALAVMTIIIAIDLPMSTLSGALVGYERLDLLNKIEVVVRLASALTVFFVMKSGGGMVELALIHGGMASVRWILTSLVLRRVTGDLPITPKLYSHKPAKALGGYAGRTLGVNLSMMIIDRTDLIVIGIYLDATWVTIYAIGQQIVTYLAAGGASAMFAFTPRLTQIAARNDYEELERVYILGARTSACLIVPLAACLLVFGSPFIRLWIGDAYVTGDFAGRSDVIMALLMLGNLPRMLHSIMRQLLFATRRQGFLAKLSIGEAVVNLGLSILLVQRWALIGVAIGTLIPLALTQIVLLPAFISNQYGFPYRRFLARGLARPVTVGIVLFLVGTGLTRQFPPDGWGLLALEGMTVVLTGMMLVFVVVLSSNERHRVIETVSRFAQRVNGKVS